MSITLCSSSVKDFLQVSSGIIAKQPELSYLVGGQWICSRPGASGGDFYWPEAGWTKNRNQERRVAGGEVCKQFLSSITISDMQLFLLSKMNANFYDL